MMSRTNGLGDEIDASPGDAMNFPG